MQTYEQLLYSAFKAQFPVASAWDITRMVQVATNVKEPSVSNYPAGTVARDKEGGVWIKTDGFDGDSDPDAWIRFLGNSAMVGPDYRSNDNMQEVIDEVLTTVEVG